MEQDEIIKSKIFFNSKLSNNIASKIYDGIANGFKFFAIITLLGNDKLSASVTTDLLWDVLLDVLLHNDINVQTIREAIRKARQKLILLIQKDNDLAEAGVDLHIVITALHPLLSVAYIGSFGDCDVYLLREGKFIDFKKYLQQDQNTYQCISFKLQSNDAFLISSPNTATAYIDTAFGDEAIKPSFGKIAKGLKQLQPAFTGIQTLVLIGFNLKTIKTVQAVRPQKRIENERKTNKYKQIIISQTNKFVNQAKHILKKLKNKIAKLKEKIKQKQKRKPTVAQNAPLDNKDRTLGTIRPVTNPTIRRIKSLLSRFNIGFGDKYKPKVQFRFNSKEKILKIIAIIGIIFIIVLIWRGIKHNKEYKQEITNVQTIVSNVQQSLDTFKSSPSDNAANELLQQKQKLSKLSTELNNMQLKDKDQEIIQTITNLQKEIQQEYNNFYKIHSLNNANITVVMDTLSTCEIEKPTDIAYNSPYLAIISAEEHKLCMYNVQNKSTRIVNQDDVKTPISVAEYEDGFYIYDQEKGIIQIETMVDDQPIGNPHSLELTTIPELTPATIGKCSEIETYNGNIYFLNRDEGKVRKAVYDEEIGGFIMPYDYFANDEFTHASDILIDGNIYIITKSPSKLIKYVAGERDSVRLSGLTTEETENLKRGDTEYGDNTYLYIAVGNKILVLEKFTSELHPGIILLVYRIEYQPSVGEKDMKYMQNLSELEIIDNENAYVLDGTNILKIPLQ